MTTLKAFLKKLFKIREKTQYERAQRFYKSNPSLYSAEMFKDDYLKTRGVNAARKLEELNQARKVEEQ